MNARDAKKEAQQGLKLIREFHGQKNGSDYIVGAAWAIFAHIAGDRSKAPWDDAAKAAVAEHRGQS